MEIRFTFSIYLYRILIQKKYKVEYSCRMKYAIILTLCLVFSGCSRDEPVQRHFAMQEMKGRNYEGKSFAVYRARIPDHWVRRDPLPDEDLNDTTKAICEFIIRQDGAMVRIAVHNFPSDTIEQRIPPNAQVARWQRQFESLLPTESSLVPQVYNGYSGLLFRGIGRIDGRETGVLGWSLQVAPEHYRMLTHPKDVKMTNLYREMRADVTIKAVGPRGLIEENEDAIAHFARSFELIEEIPLRS